MTLYNVFIVLAPRRSFVSQSEILGTMIFQYLLLPMFFSTFYCITDPGSINIGYLCINMGFLWF